MLDGEFENLSNDGRILYTLLKDRHDLSIKNDWYNEKGEVYFIMTRAEMENMLNLSPKTTRKVITELKNLNLIEEERRGNNQTNLIYLLKVKTSRSRPVKSNTPDREKFPPININQNQTDFNETDYQSIGKIIPLRMNLIRIP